MPKGLRLTAQQYAECWGERIEQDRKALAEKVEAATAAKAAAIAKAEATAAARQAAVDAANDAAVAAANGDLASEMSASIISSRMTTNTDVALEKIERLERKLAQEQARRAALEAQLERAKTPPLIG